MVFALEAVFARQGDALLLHYGSVSAPRFALIDGGPGGVYGDYLRPRLDELRDELGLDDDQGLPLQLVMVTHSDADHIAGVLDLFEDDLDADAQHRPLPYDIKNLWHNSYDDVVGADAGKVAEVVQGNVAGAGHEAVVASVADARQLRGFAEMLAVGVVNRGQALVVASGGPADVVDFGDGLTLRIICPDQARIDGYRKLWQKELPKILAKEKKAAEVAAMVDSSPSNLASIVVVATVGDRTMLLTGDARGDDILAGLRAASAESLPLSADSPSVSADSPSVSAESPSVSAESPPFRFDLLKMPHHGSSRNVDEDFFRRVVADHYVFSGDGHEGNPEVETLRMIAAARGSDAYTLHFTLPADAVDREDNPQRKAILAKLMTWLESERSPTCSVVFRDPTRTPASITVDLEGGPSGLGPG